MMIEFICTIRKGKGKCMWTGRSIWPRSRNRTSLTVYIVRTGKEMMDIGIA